MEPQTQTVTFSGEDGTKGDASYRVMGDGCAAWAMGRGTVIVDNAIRGARGEAWGWAVAYRDTRTARQAGPLAGSGGAEGELR